MKRGDESTARGSIEGKRPIGVSAAPTEKTEARPDGLEDGIRAARPAAEGVPGRTSKPLAGRTDPYNDPYGPR